MSAPLDRQLNPGNVSRSLYRVGFAAVVVMLALQVASAQKESPVEQVASHAFEIKTSSGSGMMPFEISIDWGKPQPAITRAVVIFHGKGRDVEGYYRAALRAADLAGGDAAATTIVVAPQFLNEEDARAHGLQANVLRWRQGVWEAGVDAAGPSPINAYAVVDAIVAHLADRSIFPNLKTIVLAGHSGGGQAMQRYAIVGHAEKIAGEGIRIRYVIANPSSYLYFTDDRPVFAGSSFHFEPLTRSDCHNFDHWKFGPQEIKDDEGYVKESAAAGWQALEDAFAKKDVTYLLGTADIDPREKDLDVSCAGEIEGPSRFLRGQAYYSWLHARDAAEWNQRMWFVPDVAHNATRMFTSECGVAALYERTRCKDQ